MFTKEETIQAIGKLKQRKAPGPDGLPPEKIATMVRQYTEKCLCVMNVINRKVINAMENGKTGIPREKKPDQQSNSYWRICTLNILGKLLKQLLLRRLRNRIEEREGVAAGAIWV